MPARKIGRKISVTEITKGLLAKTVDLALVGVYFGLEFAVSGRQGHYQASNKALSDLDNINYASISRALKNLRNKGLLQTTKEKYCLPIITKTGQKKLKSIIPFYDNKRIWDGIVYLITYDLPRSENHKRDLLRKLLKQISCGMLQESVFVTAYNPREILNRFYTEHGVEKGSIVIASLGKDGAIGDRGIPNILEEVFGLKSLNGRYKAFMAKYDSNQKDRKELLIEYLLILKDDPQLPFSLLPDYWVGDKAHQIFEKLENNRGKSCYFGNARAVRK